MGICSNALKITQNGIVGALHEKRFASSMRKRFHFSATKLLNF